MARWHHQWNGHELGQTLRDGEEQGGLKCCSLWNHEEQDMTGQLNNSIISKGKTKTKKMISKNVSGKHKEKGDSYGSVEFYEKQNKELSHFLLIKVVVHNADVIAVYLFFCTQSESFL